MHDIWNPWHGCIKISEGCQYCYLYSLDRMRDQDGSRIYKTGHFHYPIPKNRQGGYRFGLDIPEEERYVPHYRSGCDDCGKCNGR